MKDGVQAFIDAFDQIMTALEGRCQLK